MFSRYPFEYAPITQLWAGTAPEAADMNGKVGLFAFCFRTLLDSLLKYVIPWGKLGKPHPAVNDEALTAELWAWLEARVVEYEAKGKAPDGHVP